MDIALIVLKQIFSMTAMLLIGYLCAKRGILDSESARKLSSFILLVPTSAVIISAFNRESDPALTANLGMAVLVAILSHAVGIVVATAFFRDKNNPEHAGTRASVVFSNSGFFSFPILSAMFGSTGIFLGSAYLIVFNILCWTYLTYILTGDKSQISLKKALLNPATISISIGLLIYFMPAKLPDFIFIPIDSIGSINTPLAMMVSGVFMSEISILEAFTSAKVWFAALLRLIAVPLITVFILWALPINNMVAQTILVAASAPAAVGTAMFCARLGKEVATPTKIVTVTSIFCIVTLPLLMLLSKVLWG